MRGSAPQTLEYRTNLNALPLIGSIRLDSITAPQNLGRVWPEILHAGGTLTGLIV